MVLCSDASKVPPRDLLRHDATHAQPGSPEVEAQRRGPLIGRCEIVRVRRGPHAHRREEVIENVRVDHHEL